MEISWHGTDPDRLATVLATGTDDAGARISPFVDREGGWPLRCCLADSRPGDRVAILGWSPFAWVGPYRETGPVVVHAGGCPGHDGSFPRQFEGRDQVVRAFGDDEGRTNTQVYDLHRVVRAGEGCGRTCPRCSLTPGYGRCTCTTSSRSASASPRRAWGDRGAAG